MGYIQQQEKNVTCLRKHERTRSMNRELSEETKVHQIKTFTT